MFSLPLMDKWTTTFLPLVIQTAAERKLCDVEKSVLIRKMYTHHISMHTSDKYRPRLREQGKG